MKEIKFPLLTKDDIELRIGQVSKDGTKASLLLYQDARCGMKYLDQVVGANKWQKKYYEVRGLVICSLGIYDDEMQQWLWKDDTGSAGSIEEEKSIISDSFKRCLVCWGLARELYTSPIIWVKINSKYDKFYVKSISYNENREIKTLEIVNERQELVYSYGLGGKVSQTSEKVVKNPISNNETKVVGNREEDKKVVDSYINNLSMEKYEQFEEFLKRSFNKTNIGDLTDSEYHRLAEKIRKA